MKQGKIDMTTIKANNTALILDCLRNKQVSRIEISKMTGLSKSAVTIIINDLISDGLICETGSMESRIGRRPIMLDINPNHRFVIGVNIHRKGISVSIIDLKLQSIDSARTLSYHYKDPHSILQWINMTIEKLMVANHLTWDKCLGIGCSSPGPVDCQRGIILEPMDFPLFTNFPLIDELKKYYDKPMFLENNSVLLATTEYRLSTLSLSQHSQILFIVVMNGVGSALITNGQIMRGSAGFAGEIGHTSINLNGTRCPCGNRGCLEQYVTITALKKRFGFEDYDRVVDDAYLNLPYAMEIMQHLANNLACALNNSVNLLDLDAIVLSGELNYRHKLLFSLVEELLKSHSVVLRSHPVKIMASAITPQSSDIACAAYVLDRYFGQEL